MDQDEGNFPSPMKRRSLVRLVSFVSRTVRRHRQSAGDTSGSVGRAVSASLCPGGATGGKTALTASTRTNVSTFKQIFTNETRLFGSTCEFAFTGSRRKCPVHLYQCGSGECVDPSLVCNRVTNCADSSDEGAGCAQGNCSSSSAPRCDHHCVSTPNGAVSVRQT